MNRYKYKTQDEAIKNYAELMKDNWGWDWYWYYTTNQKQKIGDTSKEIFIQTLRKGENLKPNPLEIQIQTKGIKLWGCDAESATWIIFGEKAIEEWRVLDSNKPYYRYIEHKPAYKEYFQERFKSIIGGKDQSVSDFNIEIFREKIQVDATQIQVKWGSIAAVAVVKAKAESDLDIAKLYDISDVLECAPEFNEAIKEIKESSQIKGKTNSIYYLFESNESVDRGGVAYQFLPAYTFNTDVTKFFNLSLFENPTYFKEDDSLLNNCQYDVLGSVSAVIGPDGGEIVLPDEADNVDKVLEVKEIIPEGALDESVEFVIRRINISNCVCYNNIQDGDETGVDCGGRCGACEETCYDGIQNQDETGIDVGGVCVMESISNAEEPCEWDLNQDGKVKQCVECQENKNCSEYSCGGYNPVCRGSQCDCLTFDFYYDDKAEFLRLINNAAKKKFYENDKESLSNFLSVVRGWVSKNF